MKLGVYAPVAKTATGKGTRQPSIQFRRYFAVFQIDLVGCAYRVR